MSPQQAAIKRATLTAQADMNRLDAAQLEDLQAVYQQAAHDLQAQIAAHADGDGNVPLYRLQDLLAQVNTRLAQLSAARNALLNGGLQQAAALGMQPLTAGASSIAADGLLTAGAAATVARDAVSFVRAFIAADGLQLSDRIWRLDRQARDSVANAIESAIIQGHGAAQAAREFLMRGEPVPREVADKMQMANGTRIGRDAAALILGDGFGSPMDNAMRVMRTELNRAHGEAYMAGGERHPDFAGWRFLLSPAHPKHDICDLHAAANLYGLGPGVYPSRAACPWPAHPNTLSYVEIVFRDEISAADQAGKETPLQALDRMTPAQQLGVLGKNKAAVFEDGKLSQGMIKAPWRSVKKRIA